VTKQWQPVAIPFGVGLGGKTDARVIDPPDLTIAQDVEFEEVGGLQTRKPLQNLGLTVASGSTAIAAADVRRIVPNGDELLLFTVDRLYSWDSTNSWWIERDTHLATTIDEHSRFSTPDDQLDVDRAELNGCVITTWHVAQASGNPVGWVAAHNATTGAVILSPVTIAGAVRVRVIALDTKILISFRDAIGIRVAAIDPANPSAAIATVLAGAAATILVDSLAGPYDVCKIVGADQAAYAIATALSGPTYTSYQLSRVTAALSITSVTRVRTAQCIGLACSTTGVLLIARRVTSSVLADQVTASTLADTAFIGVTLGTSSATITQITASWRTTLDSGVYRCYVYWNNTAADGAPAVTSNYIDSAGTAASSSQFAAGVSIGSRAFTYQTSSTVSAVFVWLVFAETSTFDGKAEKFSYQLQNTYFLYRDDALLCAKSIASRAAGAITQTGWLPTVQALSSTRFAFGGAERRVIDIGGAGIRRTNYAARAPREIFVTFDDNKARRCVRLGESLYVAGGEIKQYDGIRLVEVGFHIYPSYLTLTSWGGSMDVGDFAYKFTPRWDSGNGEIDRGTTATVGIFTNASGATGGLATTRNLYQTHKTGIALECWRTQVNPTADAPFYLVTSKDPTSTAGGTSPPNQYIANKPNGSAANSLFDDLNDDVLTPNEQCPENSGLESLAPPAATIIAANADRLFIAGIAGDPNRIWYSKTRNDGSVASFNDGLSFAVPPAGGAITGLAFLNETLIVFKDSAVYALPGDGYDNAGNGQNYGPARVLSVDVGALDHDSIALTPGGLVFHSRKGKYLLNRGWGVDFIGASVSDYDAESVLSVDVVEAQHQVRWVTASRVLVLDYLAKTQDDPYGQWSTWTMANGLDGALWNHQWLLLSSTVGVQQQRTDFTGIDYGQDVATAWIKMGSLQGAGSVRWLEVLGELRGSCALRVQLYRDYQTTAYQTVYWTPSPSVVGGPLQCRIGPSVPKCEAIKVRITVGTYSGGVFSAATTEGVKLSGLGLEVGLDRGLYRNLLVAQKAS
jgi:hypothetical protein